MGKGYAVWIHAVSVGEVNAAVPLVKRLRRQMPLYRVILSTVTDTGQSVARRHFHEEISICYVPFDIPFCLRRFMTTGMVRLVVIMETELWPNMIRVAEDLSIPVLLINGRISARSFEGYRKVSFFMRRVLEKMSCLAMQNRQYAERIITLGAPAEKTEIMGNLKFDIYIEPKLPDWTKGLSGKIVIAGSTHRPEEEMIIDAFARCSMNHPQLTLIIAPRHPERFKEVETLLNNRGIEYIRRSDFDKGQGIRDCKYVLLDVVGELASLYGVCDVAVMGGSFIPHGGQNPLEAAYWSKPIICGPYMDNFYFIEDFYRAGAAVKVDEKGLYEALDRFLTDERFAETAGRAARSFIDANAGSLEKAMAVIDKYLLAR